MTTKRCRHAQRFRLTAESPKHSYGFAQVWSTKSDDDAQANYKAKRPLARAQAWCPACGKFQVNGRWLMPGSELVATLRQKAKA